MSEPTEKPPVEEKTEKNDNNQSVKTEQLSDSIAQKKPMNLILVGLVSVTCILMLSLGILSTLLLTNVNQTPQLASVQNNEKTEAKKTVQKTENKEEKKIENKEESREGEKESESNSASSAPEFYQVRPSIIITLPVSGRTRYVSLDIDLMTHTKSSVKILEAYGPLIKSSLIELLSKQTFEEMISEEGKKNIRKQALTTLQTLMNEQAGDPIVEQVLFTSFIVQ